MESAEFGEGESCNDGNKERIHAETVEENRELPAVACSGRSHRSIQHLGRGQRASSREVRSKGHRYQQLGCRKSPWFPRWRKVPLRSGDTQSSRDCRCSRPTSDV